MVSPGTRKKQRCSTIFLGVVGKNFWGFNRPELWLLTSWYFHFASLSAWFKAVAIWICYRLAHQNQGCFNPPRQNRGGAVATQWSIYGGCPRGASLIHHKHEPISQFSVNMTPACATNFSPVALKPSNFQPRSHYGWTFLGGSKVRATWVVLSTRHSHSPSQR